MVKSLTRSVWCKSRSSRIQYCPTNQTATLKRRAAAMSCHVDDLACIEDLVAGALTGTRIAEALLSDRLARVLLAGCVLSLACLCAMVVKICSLLHDGNEKRPTHTLPPRQTPKPQNLRGQKHEANRVRRVHAESAQGAPSSHVQAAQPHLPLPGFPARRLEGPSHHESQSPAPVLQSATSSMKRPLSDGKSVNQDPTHRSWRLPGSGGIVASEHPGASGDQDVHASCSCFCGKRERGELGGQQSRPDAS